MKIVTLFIPAIILTIAACSPKPPPPSHAWRTCPAVRPAGNTVSIMPIDVRVNITGKTSRKQYNSMWRNAVNTSLTLQKHLPDFLASRYYRVQDQVLWSGRSVTPAGRYFSLLSERELAQAVFSLAHFTGKLSEGSLKHNIAPAVFKKMKSASDMTLYVANWYNVRVQQTNAFLEFLKVTLIVVGVAIIVLGIVGAITAAAGKGGGGNMSGLGGLFKVGGKLFVYGAKGIANVAGRIFVRSLARTAGRVALHTARVAIRVAVRVAVEGPIIIDIPQTYVIPAYDEAPTGATDTVNRYLGVENGVSSLKPVMSQYGYLMNLILVNNSNGAVVWDGRVFVPQGAKTDKIKSMMQQLFSSMPRGVMPLPALEQ